MKLCLPLIVLLCLASTSYSQESDQATDFDFIPAEVLEAERRATVLPAELNVLTATGVTVGAPDNETRRATAIDQAAQIRQIQADSIATRLDLQPGDLIVRVNDQEISNPNQLQEILTNQCRLGRRSVSLGLTRPETRSSLRVELPLPLYGAKYEAADKAYSAEITDGWFLIPNLRNKVVDPGFDSLISGDTEVVMILARQGIPVQHPVRDLKAYERDKLAQAQRFLDPRSEPLQIDTTTGFRLSYRHPVQPMSVSRMAFVSKSKRYVINVVRTNVLNSNLSPEVVQFIQSIGLR